jgi:hypothetical protein
MGYSFLSGDGIGATIPRAHAIPQTVYERVLRDSDVLPEGM